MQSFPSPKFSLSLSVPRLESAKQEGQSHDKIEETATSMRVSKCTEETRGLPQTAEGDRAYVVFIGRDGRDYLSEVMSKLDVTVRQDAVKAALEKGWV